MALRGGSIITSAGEDVLQRVQSVGPGDLTIPEEKIYETGNWNAVETVYDTPEATYDVESYDSSCDFEARLIGRDPATFPTTIGSNEIDLRNAIPVNMLSLAKSQRNAYDIVSGAIVSGLNLSSATWRFGVGESATQSFSMSTDSVFYTMGPPYTETINLASGSQVYNITRTADEYTGEGGTQYILSVMLVDTANGLPMKNKRVFFDPEADFSTPASSDSGYSNTATAFRLPEDESSTYDKVIVTYSSAASPVDYTQTGNSPYGKKIHVTSSVRPGAIRSRDIKVFLGTTDATPVFTEFKGVQNIEATWSVTLENDEELGNARFVAQEYDVPEVTGSIGVLPRDPADLMDKLYRVTGVTPGEVIGPNLNMPIPVEIRIYHPRTKAVLKTLYIPNARFTVPGFTAQVQTKMEQTLNFSSDTGEIYVYNGARTA